MTTFLTGASGHLGGNVARALLTEGAKVRALLRDGSNNEAVDGLEIERVYGDLSDEGALADAMSGCDRLLHLAAMVSLRDADSAALEEANVAGTRRLMAAAKRVGVKRAVHCSSLAAVGKPSAMPYERSKVRGELEVARAAEEGLDVSIAQPSGLVGPNDFKPSMIGQTIVDFAEGRLPAFVDGGYDFVDVRAVAKGHLLALEKGERAQRYMLTGEFVSLREVLQWLGLMLGRPPPRIALPPELVAPLASVKDFVQARLFPGHQPRFNRHSIDLLREGKRGDNTRARTELGWEPGSVRNAFADHVQWLREHGQLEIRKPSRWWL